MTPPRRGIVEVPAPLDRHPRQVHLRLRLCVVVRQQIRAVLQPWNLYSRQIAPRLALLYPQALDVKVFYLAASGSLHYPTGRRAVSEQSQW